MRSLGPSRLPVPRGGLVPVAAACLSALLAARASTDEGMWLFNQLPAGRLEERYGFTAGEDWARRVMRSSARISAGGSGSIVSPSGLVMTNHHVVSDILQQLSTPERNLVEEGFFARSHEEELRCPSVEVDVLWEIEDVTERVNAAVRPGMDPAAAEMERRAARAAIEKESKERTGLFSEVVTLYRGARYHLYRYKRYDDVRMVMAPEVAVAYFGGDADNFEFPRYSLDVAFLRLYEEGKPAQVEQYLRWSRAGVEAGDLVFVSGHPGRTQRLNTPDHIRFLRDVAYPSFLELLYRREIGLQQFSLEGEEAERIAKGDLFGIENSRKALRGMLAGLLDPDVLAAKEREEEGIRAAVAADPELGASLDDWDRIRSSLEASRGFRDEYNFLEQGRAFWSDLYSHARTLVRLAAERAKPDGERLPEYRETALPAILRRLESEVPIYPELEVAKLTDSLTHFAETFGAEHPLVRLVLDGAGPSERASRLVAGTALLDAQARKELAGAGPEGIARSEDPMILLARKVEPYARASRQKYDDLVESVRVEAYAGIAQAEFAVTGTEVYPDATFTLRLAFGVVKGWEEGGRHVPYFTTLGGLFEESKQHGNAPPYRLPPSWTARAPGTDGLDPGVPLNFVSTPDIVGGNSGSPVIDRNAEVVGLIFDGNIHSLVLDVVYTEERARAISVDVRAILAALRDVYGMEGLAGELLGR